MASGMPCSGPVCRRLPAAFAAARAWSASTVLKAWYTGSYAPTRARYASTRSAGVSLPFLIIQAASASVSSVGSAKASGRGRTYAPGPNRAGPPAQATPGMAEAPAAAAAASAAVRARNARLSTVLICATPC
jgi:hypothetical protein